MEAKYVHTPAVAPNTPPVEPPEPQESLKPAESAAAQERKPVESRRVLEDQIRARPAIFMGGGFILGLVLGVFLRR